VNIGPHLFERVSRDHGAAVSFVEKVGELHGFGALHKAQGEQGIRL
jgi:hypothetical protein